MSSKLTATIAGIAVCVLYLVGTMTLVQGLHLDTQEAVGLFGEGFYVVYEGGTLSSSYIDNDMIGEIPGNISTGTVMHAEISGVGFNLSYESIRIVVLDDKHNIVGGQSLELCDKGLPGKDLAELPSGSEIILRLEGVEKNLTISSNFAPYKSEVFPNDWLLVPQDIASALDSRRADSKSFIIVPANNTEGIEFLKSNGYDVVQSIGVIDFFELGVYQVERNLWGLVLTSSVVIVILVFSVMSVEVLNRAPDIRIMRYLGAEPKHIMVIFILQSAFVAALGSVIGTALGLIAANALVSFAPIFGFESMISPNVSFYSIGIPVCIALISGVVGGFFPALKASRTDIRTRKEVL